MLIEESNFFNDFYNEKINIVKQWMRDNHCLVYEDYSLSGLTGGVPIIYMGSIKDLYTEEELYKEDFKNYIIKTTPRIKLDHYDKFYIIKKESVV